MLAEYAPIDGCALASFARVEQRDGFLQRHLVGALALGDVGVDLLPVHVRPVFSGLHGDGAALGMVAERAAGLRPKAAGAAAAGFLRDDEINGAIGANLQHIVVAANVGVGFLMLHIRTKAADIGDNRLAGGGMFGHFARQR